MPTRARQEEQRPVPAPQPAPVSPLRARSAVVTLFVIAGAVMGGWSGRIPTIKDELGLGDAQWGLVVLAQPAGTLLALLVLTRVISRTGPRTLALPGAVLLLVVAPFAALSPSVVFLAPALALMGLATGLLFSPMNALAVDVERRYGRSIMSSFHAWFSVGQLGGGVAGAVAGHLGVGPWLQLAVCAVVLAVVLACTATALPRGRDDHAGHADHDGPVTRRSSRREPPTRQLLLLAGLALLAAMTEGSAVQWSAQYSVSLGAGVATGSLTLVCFSLAIALTRSFGDRLVDRFGRVGFVRVSATVTASGVLLAVLTGSIPGALVGFALVGVGSACVFPVIMGLAGNQPDVPAGRAVALVNLGEWPAFFLGPPLIGLVAEFSSLRVSLGLLVVTSLLVAVLAGWIRVPVGLVRSSGSGVPTR